MSEKIEARDDIGQVIDGNVHEAPRFNNVINLHLNEAKREVQRITEYQRKRIKMLVKQWAAICGDEETEIYKIFIEDFGIRYFSDLPIEHYVTVKKTLEEWIAASVGKHKIAAVAPALEAVLQPTTLVQAPGECVACKEKNASFARSQRVIVALGILVLFLAGSCAWFLYQMPAPNDATDASGHCIYEGKPYSAGSTIKVAGGALKECIAASDGRTSTWLRAK